MKDFYKAPFNCYTSNSLNHLAGLCADNISSQQGSDKVYLAYPSNEVKEFFIQSFIEKNTHLFGIRFISIPQFIHLSLKICYKKDLLFPSHYELMFFLEEAITQLINGNKNIAEPLKDYIQNDPNRISSLASSLSHIFLDYLLYGRKVLPNWQKQDAWQPYLFEKVTKRWTCIISAIEKAPKPSFPLSLHIFCIDYCPPLYLSFFEKLSKHFTFSFYFFSPSPLFWGDLISCKKSAYLDTIFQKKNVSVEQRLEFSNYNKANHPLLSHFCQASKPLYLYLNQFDPEEHYVDIELSTNLSYLQKTIFYQTKPQPLPFNDNTFSIHCTPNMLREVEVVIKNIEKTLYENKNLHPSDIVVIAPNIDVYYPYISFLFAGKKLGFSYTISNLTIVKHNQELEGLYLLFSLVDSRFEKNDLLKLFQSPYFQRKAQIHTQEVKILEKIIQHTGIRWGYNQSSKKTILESANVCNFGLFDKGFSYLLELIAQKDSPMEFSEAESIGDVIMLTQSLHEDIQTFKNEDKTLSQWIEQTFELANKYLYFEAEENIFFKEIKKITPLAQHCDFLFSFKSFAKMFSEIFQKKGAFEKTYQNPPITFSSIENSPPINKTLFFIGCDEENFPKKETKRSLHELNENPLYEKNTTKTSEMRYYLLKAIFSAKHAIYFSYSKKNPNDGRERNYSLLIEEIIHALDLPPPINHPISSYSPYYFSSPNPFKRIEPLYQSSKANPPLLFPEINPTNNEEKNTHIECKHLHLLFLSPCKFFFNLSTNLYESNKESHTYIDDQEFTLSYLDRAIFKKRKIFQPKVEFHDLISTNKLPCAIFQKAATKELTHSIQQDKALLKKYISDQNPYITLCLDPHIHQPTKKDSTYFFPSINQPFNQTLFQISGNLENITEKGLISFKKKTSSELWKFLPSLIILSLIPSNIPCHITFLTTGETMRFEKASLKQLLPTMLAYYFKALEKPSPIIPESIPSYLDKNTICFLSLKEKILNSFEDPYLSMAKPEKYTYFEEELKILTNFIKMQMKESLV